MYKADVLLYSVQQLGNYLVSCNVQIFPYVVKEIISNIYWVLVSSFNILHMQWRIQDLPLGGRRPVGGRQPLMHTLFGKNVCEKERNGSCRGGGGAPWIRQ